MFFYEVTCFACKKSFKVYEGSFAYKQRKENNTKLFCCDDCKHKIRLDAIKNFFR